MIILFVTARCLETLDSEFSSKAIKESFGNENTFQAFADDFENGYSGGWFSINMRINILCIPELCGFYSEMLLIVWKDIKSFLKIDDDEKTMIPIFWTSYQQYLFIKMGIIVFYAAFYFKYFYLFFFLVVLFADEIIVFQIIIYV